jgi:hypothetical protein
VTAPISVNQFNLALEQEMRKYGNQIPERGFSGAGYWWYGYPTYMGSAAMFNGVTSAAQWSEQAQPDADSKMAGAISEAGADTSGVNSGASGIDAN